MTEGLACAFSRMSQLTMNNKTMKTLPPPCHRPTVFARVPAGIMSQSIRPKMAASKAPITPAVIIQKATTEKKPLPVIQWMMSKKSDVASNPSGKTISMGWMGCPSALTLLSITYLLACYSKRVMEQVEILSTRLLLEALAYRLRHSIMRELNNKRILALGDSYGTIRNVYRWPSAHTSAPHPSKNSTRNDEFCSYSPLHTVVRVNDAVSFTPRICIQRW